MPQPQRKLDLATWLRSLPEPGSGNLLLGGTGHLLLSPLEQTQAAEHLRTQVLPGLFSAPNLGRITLVTGLAPGADLLFKRVAADWLQRASITFEAVALLPVPVEVLLGDWVLKSHSESEWVNGGELEAMRDDIATVLAGCDAVVDLLPASVDRARFGEEAFRQQQYRRLAACLAEQTDVLIALLRAQNVQQPGGTAEVVEWRRNPRLIPPQLSTLPLRTPRAGGHALMVIDPTMAVPDSGQGTNLSGTGEPVTLTARDQLLAELLASCRQSLQAGNYLQCYDQAKRAQAQGIAARSLDYLSLLALANAGSTQLALKRFRELGLGEGDLDEDWLALEGRLLKDLALTSGNKADAIELYLRSGRAYLAAFMRTGGHFTAINAATMLLLGNRNEEALVLARDVLAMVTTAKPADETADYYLRVTEAEAALLLGDVERCRVALAKADRLLGDNLNVRSRSAAQLRLICRHCGISDDILGALSLAPVIYVQQPDDGSFDAITALTLPAGVSFVFAGLTQPAELRIAEHFLRREARVHLVLPSPRAALLDHWRRHYGADWATRLDRCLDLAHETSVALGFLDDEDRWCSAHVSAMALGLSRLTSKRLGCRWEVLETGRSSGDVKLTPLPAGAQFDSTLIRRLTGPDPDETMTTVGGDIGRRFIGTIFADFAGFSRLSDEEMPRFQSLFIGSIADMLSRWRGKILLQHTWGDAVHIVTTDAESAADIAAEIHAIVDRVRPSLDGMLARLELRLAAHYAPVYVGVDPIENTPTFFGTQLSFTARIEPVTPPGMIFVTEAFAARLALEAPERFITEYAGEIELAKRFGQYRLFSLRRVVSGAA